MQLGEIKRGTTVAGSLRTSQLNLHNYTIFKFLEQVRQGFFLIRNNMTTYERLSRIELKVVGSKAPPLWCDAITGYFETALRIGMDQ